MLGVLNSMASAVQSRTASGLENAGAWLPLLVMPAAVALVGWRWPAWVLMWSLAVSIYGGFKWLTFTDCLEAHRAGLGRNLGYLLLWPGMDARAFFDRNCRVPRPTTAEWVWSGAKTLFGVTLIYGVTPSAFGWNQLLAGWIGMIGIAFVLHFGLFDLLSVIWRQAGVDARPIMNNPIMASSLSDFWGSRWNLAFRDLAHEYVFRAFIRRVGIAGATLVVFVLSGLIHDLVMSIPAEGGWGLPTLYFCIQGFGLLLERSEIGKRIGLGKGWMGRLFGAAVTVLPLGLLFHPPFVLRVIVPTLTAMGAM